MMEMFFSGLQTNSKVSWIVRRLRTMSCFEVTKNQQKQHMAIFMVQTIVGEIYPTHPPSKQASKQTSKQKKSPTYQHQLGPSKQPTNTFPPKQSYMTTSWENKQTRTQQTLKTNPKSLVFQTKAKRKIRNPPLSFVFFARIPKNTKKTKQKA